LRNLVTAKFLWKDAITGVSPAGRTLLAAIPEPPKRGVSALRVTIPDALMDRRRRGQPAAHRPGERHGRSWPPPSRRMGCCNPCSFARSLHDSGAPTRRYEVVAGKDVGEASLAESVIRLDMHAADQFEAPAPGRTGVGASRTSRPGSGSPLNLSGNGSGCPPSPLACCAVLGRLSPSTWSGGRGGPAASCALPRLACTAWLHPPRYTAITRRHSRKGTFILPRS
jgi:hypothetical protein